MEITDALLSEQYQTALKDLNQKEYRKAANLCCKILKHRQTDLNVINLLAICAHHLNKYKTAIRLFDIINKLSPNNAIYLNNQGSILKAQGDITGAIAVYQQAIAVSQQNFEACFNLAKLYEQTTQPLKALSCYEQVMRIEPNNIQALLLSGTLLQKLGQQRIAIKAFKKVLLLNPNDIIALLGLALCLQSLDLHAESIGYYQKILTISPNHIQSYINLGVAYKKIENYDEAINFYKKALELAPNLDYVYTNLANALAACNRYEDAIEMYNAAIERNANSADNYSGLGFAQHSLGDYKNAAGNFDKAIVINPQHIDAHFNRSLNFLVQGDFENGWKEYEWRTKKPEMINMIKQIPYPLWDGSPLGNKTLIVYAEQGFGDNIQFIRYLPLINKQSGKIILGGRLELARLFQQVRAIDHFNIRGNLLPDVDAYIPLLSLPLIMGTTVETIPASIPYLSAYEHDVQEAKKLFTLDDEILRIGICWTGSPTHRNARNRSCSLELFKTLAATRLHFYSLQKTIAQQQIPTTMPLTDLSGYLTDFAATAAMIAHLDLVITVDTSVAHLAGAMGKPVWNLLAFNHDWRWMAKRSDTPWYPTMRLYRQSTIDDWESIFKQIKKDLKKVQPVRV